MEKKYDYSQIPSSWKFCFNGNCPMSGECLRYQTALTIPANRVWGQAVFPTALKDGQCVFFRRDEQVTLATGFVTGRQDIDKTFVRLRHDIENIVGGGGTYYLYRNGKQWLSPDQQEAIIRLFRAAGCSEEHLFAEEKQGYLFV